MRKFLAILFTAALLLSCSGDEPKTSGDAENTEGVDGTGAREDSESTVERMEELGY